MRDGQEKEWEVDAFKGTVCATFLLTSLRVHFGTSGYEEIKMTQFV